MDAMLDALYEEPREGDLTGWICNDPDVRSGAIKFTFSLGDKLYRVTRTRLKSGKATLNIAEFTDDEWIDRSKEKLRDTQAEIENIIGMDSLTLKACALIMQDQYGLFLQADKEVRMSILGNILGLGIYGIMEDKASNSASNINRELRKTNDSIEEIERSLPNEQILKNESEKIQSTIDSVNQQIKENNIKLENKRLKLSMAMQSDERIKKLAEDIKGLENKKINAENGLITQNMIVNKADEILKQEPEILAGVSTYNNLLKKEKELLTGKAQYDAKQQEYIRVNSEFGQVQQEVISLEEVKNNLLRKKDECLQVTSKECVIKEKADKHKALKSEIEKIEQQSVEYLRLSAAVSDVKNKKECAETEANAEKNRLKSLIKILDEKALLLENSSCPLNGTANCKFLVDAIQAKDMISGTNAKLKSSKRHYDEILSTLQEEIEMSSSALKELQYNPDELKIKRTILAELEVYAEKYKMLDVYKEKLKDVEEQILSNELRINELNNRLECYKIQLEEVKNDIEKNVGFASEFKETTERIESVKVWIEKEKLLPVERERKALAESRISEFIKEIEDYKIDISKKAEELKNEKEASSDTELIRKEILIIETNIAANQEQIQELSKQFGAIENKLNEHKKDIERIKEFQHKANSFADTAASYELLKQAFSQDGIPHNIIRTIIPIFESTATNILGQMSGGRMSVELVTEKVLKSNNKKEVTTLDIIINDANTGALPYMSRSGGERVKAALSVILALSEIKSTKAGVQLGFLFIDEPPFLDGPGVQAYCDALEAIQQRYLDLKVMAITHDPAMKSRFPQSIDVVKTPEGSKVIYN